MCEWGAQIFTIWPRRMMSLICPSLELIWVFFGVLFHRKDGNSKCAESNSRIFCLILRLASHSCPMPHKTIRGHWGSNCSIELDSEMALLKRVLKQSISRSQIPQTEGVPWVLFAGDCFVGFWDMLHEEMAINLALAFIRVFVFIHSLAMSQSFSWIDLQFPSLLTHEDEHQKHIHPREVVRLQTTSGWRRWWRNVVLIESHSRGASEVAWESTATSSKAVTITDEWERHSGRCACEHNRGSDVYAFIVFHPDAIVAIDKSMFWDIHLDQSLGTVYIRTPSSLHCSDHVL